MLEIDLSPTSIWLILAVIFAVVEAVSLGITSIWFVFGALVAMVLAMFGAPVVAQVIVFLIVSVVLLFLTRPILVKRFKLGKEKTNIDEIIGKTGVVKEKIVNIEGKGQVVINGVTWSARSLSGEDIDIDKMVKVHKIEGVKVIVSE